MISKFFSLITGVFMLLIMLASSPACFSQKKEDVRFSLHYQNKPLTKVLSHIASKAGLGQSYIIQLLAKANPVNLDVDNMPLDSVLLLLEKGQPFNIRKIDMLIHVWEKSSADTINLVVYGHTGERLSGVTIYDSSKNRHWVTDKSGNAKISRSLPFRRLTVSYVGFTPLTFNFENDTAVFLTRKDVVAEKTFTVAYGSSSTRMHTGRVDPVDRMSTGQAGSATGLLEMGSSGMRQIRLTGFNAAKVFTELRGSFSADRNQLSPLIDEPLVVINGIPVYQGFMGYSSLSSPASGVSSPAVGLDPLAWLSDIDVKDIVLLKDAVATSLYGARGANGVIMITTRTPAKDKLSITARSGIGLTKVFSVPRLLNARQYRMMRTAAFGRDTLPMTGADAYDITRLDPTQDNNWANYLLGNEAIDHNTAMSVSTTVNNWRLLGDGTYRVRRYPLPTKTSERWVTGNATATYISTDSNWNARFNLLYSNGRTTGPLEDPYPAIYLAPMITSLYDSLGDLAWSEKGVKFNNPLGMLQNTSTTAVDKWFANAYVKYNISSATAASLNIGFTRQNLLESNVLSIAGQRPELASGQYVAGSSKQRSFAIEPQVDHTISWRRIKIKLTGALSLQQFNSSYDTATGSGFTGDEALDSAVSNIKPATNSERVQYWYYSVLGKASLELPGHFSADLSARADHSALLPHSHAWKAFGAAGLAYRFSETKLFRKISYLDFGKIRGSYGSAGRDYVGNLAPFTPLQPVPEGLKWAVMHRLESGLDLRLFHLLNLSINYYYGRSKNQYLTGPLDSTGTLPGTTVFNSPMVVVNKGWELEAGFHKDWKSDAGVSLTVSVTLPRNKISKGATNVMFDQLVDGGSLSERVVYHYLRYDKEKGHIVEDVDKNGVIDKADATVRRSQDVTLFANFRPSFRWRSFTIGFNLEVCQQVLLDPFYYETYRLVAGNGSKKLFSNQPAGYEQLPGLSTRPLWKNTSLQHYLNSDAMYRDGSYLLFKKVVADYRLPRSWTNALGLSGASIYLQADNLFCISGYSRTSAPWIQQSGTLPPVKTFTFGINIGLNKK